MAVEQVPCHPILTCAHSLEDDLRSVSTMPAGYLRTADKAEALIAFARVEAELTELKLRILATAADVAEEHAARDAGNWLAHATRITFPAARSDLLLANALEQHPTTAAALREGQVNRAQAQVIVQAVDKLPADPDIRVRAEHELVKLAQTYGPKELAILGAKILEVVAPHIAEAELGKALEREEQRARDNCSVRIKRLGEGLSRITALVPDSIAERLITCLDAEDSPRSRDGRCATSSTTGVSASSTTGVSTSSTTGGRRSSGEAFCRLLEILDPHRLPDHGGDATILMVTIPLETLSSQLGAAMLGTTLISATEARRLACTAKIIPAVLGGKGEVLDLGRARRFHTAAQRKAMRLRDKTCRAEGCSISAAWTEAHHLKPWSVGGKTDLADGVLLCSHHHHRAHDTRYSMDKLPSGDYRFHRRT